MSKITAVILTILAFAGSLGLMWWMFTGTPPEIQLAQFGFDKAEIITGLLTTLIAPVFGLFVFITITKAVENPIIGFLNKLWTPSDQPVQVATGENQGKSVYTTQPGEKHEMTVISNWWATTFLKVVTPGIVLIMVGSAIGAVQFSILNLSLVVRVFLSIMISIACLLLLEPRYIYEEWLRRNTLIIVFTHTVFYLKAYDGGLLGLLTGLVDDIQRRETPITLIREPEITTDSRRITFRGQDFHDLRNTFFDILGSQKPRGFIGKLLWRVFKPLATGVRTIFLPSFFKDASDTFVSISYGETFVNIIKQLQNLTRSSQQDMDLVSREAAEIRLRLGKNAGLDEDEARIEASTFTAERVGTMTPRTDINLWGCRVDPGRWNPRTGTTTAIVSVTPSARYHRLEVTSPREPEIPTDTLEARTDTGENRSDWAPPL